MKKVLIFAAVAETATGLALLIAPSLVGRLLLGEDFTGIATPVARVAGFALIGLGIACWPGPPLAGMLTYKNAQDLRDVAARLPLDRLLVETDSPYLAPVPVRGQRNEPAHVMHTARCLAELHGVAPEALAEQTTKNAIALFDFNKTAHRVPGGTP